MAHESEVDERLEPTEEFRELQRSFIEYLLHVGNLSPNTARAYEGDLEAYGAWLRRRELSPLTVTHRQLRGFLGELSRADYSTRTVNRRLSAVRTFSRWLERQGLTQGAAADAVSSPKIARTLPHTISNDDVTRLLKACKADESAAGVRDATLIELLFATGARISELAQLKVDGIDFGQSQVKLFGKGSKERIVPLYQGMLNRLAGYVSGARSELAAAAKGERTDALFVSTRGNAMSAAGLRDAFEKRVRQAGLGPGITPHAMRHTYATELLAGGADLRSVQELLGHASLSTTQIYTHVSIDRLKDAARQAHPRAE